MFPGISEEWTGARTPRCTPFLFARPMNCQTSPDVSFCKVNVNMIFLDAEQDRNFMLPPVLERLISHVLKAAVQDSAAWEALVD